MKGRTTKRLRNLDAEPQEAPILAYCLDPGSKRSQACTRLLASVRIGRTMRLIATALVVALASGLAPQTKPSAAKVQQKARSCVDLVQIASRATPCDATPCPSPHLLAGVGLHAIDATSSP